MTEDNDLMQTQGEGGNFPPIGPVDPIDPIDPIDPEEGAFESGIKPIEPITRWAYINEAVRMPVPIEKQEIGWATEVVDGKVVGERPLLQYENWFKYTTGEWVTYLNDVKNLTTLVSDSTTITAKANETLVLTNASTRNVTIPSTVEDNDIIQIKDASGTASNVTPINISAPAGKTFENGITNHQITVGFESKTLKISGNKIYEVSSYAPAEESGSAVYVLTPVVTSPTQGATGVSPNFTVECAPFKNTINQNNHLNTDWRIFANGVLVEESLADTVNKLSYTVSTPIEDEEIRVEITFRDSDSRVSSTRIITFFTGIGFTVIPTVTSPTAAAEVQDGDEFTSSDFATTPSGGTHTESAWEARLVSDDSLVDSYTGAANLTSWTPDLSSLTENDELKVRVSHTSSEHGNSGFSAYVQYTFVEPKLFGVEIDETNESPDGAVTYIEGAIGLTPATRTTNGDWGTTGGSNDLFKDIKPCLFQNGEVNYYLNPEDYTKKADGTDSVLTGADGDVMLEIPKIYYSLSRTGSTLTVKASRVPFTGGKAYSHTRTTEGDRDFLYVGAYLGTTVSSSLRSISGTAEPTGSKTIGTFRTEARNKTNNGTGEYDQMSFYPLSLLQALFLIRYKSRDSQTALGRGHVDDSSTPSSTGRSNTAGMYAGQTTGNVGNYVKFMGIEDFYGNKFYFIDGLFSNSTINILTAFKSFNDTGSGYTDQGVRSSTSLSSYLKIPQGDSECGFIAKEVGSPASASTYYCNFSVLAGNCVAVFGADWSAGDNGGSFYLRLSNGASSNGVTFGARLMYL